MKIIYTLLLAVITPVALSQVPVIHLESVEAIKINNDYCIQRKILAGYRNEAKVVCLESKDYQHNKNAVWSLKSLNDGIQVRKEYALKEGKTYTAIQIQNDLDNHLFVMGDEIPWIEATKKIQLKLIPKGTILESSDGGKTLKINRFPGESK